MEHSVEKYSPNTPLLGERPDLNYVELYPGTQQAINRQRGTAAISVAKALFLVGLASLIIRGSMQFLPKAVTPYLLNGFLAGGALMPLALIPWGISIAQSKATRKTEEQFYQTSKDYWTISEEEDNDTFRV